MQSIAVFIIIWHQESMQPAKKVMGYMQVCTSSQTTTPSSHHSVFYTLPNQQRQSTEGITALRKLFFNSYLQKPGTEWHSNSVT